MGTPKRCSPLSVILLLLLAQHPNCSTLYQLGVCPADASVPLKPHYELIEGTEVVWQKPENELQGVLLAFHGCSHGAIDWWPPDDNCPLCTGLPVEVSITRAVLSRGYAVVAISSRDRHYRRCWSVPRDPGTHTVDTRSVTTVLPILLQRERMTAVPLYALGASSGGAFALLLPWFHPLDGVSSQIMGLPFLYKAFLNSSSAASLGAAAAAAAVTDSPAVSWSIGPHAASQIGSSSRMRHPPVLFVHMPRDEHTAAMVANNVAALKDKGSTTHVLEINPRPVTAELLESLIPELAGQPAAATQLIAGLQKHGVLDTDKMLTNDPRSSEWRLAVLNSGAPGGQALRSRLSQRGLQDAGLWSLIWSKVDRSVYNMEIISAAEMSVGAAETFGMILSSSGMRHSSRAFVTTRELIDDSLT